MCKRLKSKGEFFIKISNLGTPEYSAGYDCLHTKTVETLFFSIIETFNAFFFRKSKLNARCYFAYLLLETFTDEEKALIIGKEILDSIGTSKEIFQGRKSVLTKK